MYDPKSPFDMWLSSVSFWRASVEMQMQVATQFMRFSGMYPGLKERSTLHGETGKPVAPKAAPKRTVRKTKVASASVTELKPATKAPVKTKPATRPAPAQKAETAKPATVKKAPAKVAAKPAVEETPVTMSAAVAKTAVEAEVKKPATRRARSAAPKSTETKAGPAATKAEAKPGAKAKPAPRRRIPRKKEVSLAPVPDAVASKDTK